ncbi:deoxynucleoside kinase [Mycolicibacterium sp. CBM1]
MTGAIAAGASTLSQVLIDTLAWDALLEGNVEQDNQFFTDAYGDFARWGFHSQVHFLVNSARRHGRLSAMLASPGPHPVVEDRTPFEHTGAYLRAYESLNRIAPREVALLRQLTAILEDRFVVPDLLVYRQMTPEQLQTRVAQRKRIGEDAADFPLLDAIRISFDSFVHEWDRSPKIILPASVDVHDSVAVAPVIRQIESALSPCDKSP